VAAHADTRRDGPSLRSVPARRRLLARLIALIRRSEAEILDDVIKHPTRRTL